MKPHTNCSCPACVPDKYENVKTQPGEPTFTSTADSWGPLPKITDYKEFNKIPFPYTCPVCSGRGLVANGFYHSISMSWMSTTAAPTESCRSCEGTGVVWYE